MSAYKFVTDGTVTYASNLFFYWNEKHKQPFGCVTPQEVSEKANLICDDAENFYHVPWLHDLPASAQGLFPESDAIEITDEEFALLEIGGEDAGDDETLAEEDAEDTEPEVPPETTEEEILTRAELTAKVLALEEELTAAKILLGVE